jgi:L-ascorbate metabolism protein UlaG (beta-lactamase superfamily)
MRIEYRGHASYLIEDSSGNRVLTDPFLDGYPLPFPRRLSVDAVAIGTPDSAHDSAYQLRGNPAVLGPERPNVKVGGLSVDGLRIAPGSERMAYVIRNGNQTVVFLGESAGDPSPEVRAALQNVDVILLAPWSPPSIREALKARRKTAVVVVHATGFPSNRPRR